MALSKTQPFKGIFFGELGKGTGLRVSLSNEILCFSKGQAAPRLLSVLLDNAVCAGGRDQGAGQSLIIELNSRQVFNLEQTALWRSPASKGRSRLHAGALGASSHRDLCLSREEPEAERCSLCTSPRFSSPSLRRIRSRRYGSGTRRDGRFPLSWVQRGTLLGSKRVAENVRIHVGVSG